MRRLKASQLSHLEASMIALDSANSYFFQDAATKLLPVLNSYNALARNSQNLYYKLLV
jgi:hypothetical protein